VNTEIPGNEPETPDVEVENEVLEDSKPPAQPPPRRRQTLALFAFLLSLAALAGTGWMWWQDQSSIDREESRMFSEIARLESSDSELSLKLSQVRDQLETMQSDDSGTEWQALQDRMQADRTRMEQLEQAIDEQLSLARSLQAAAGTINDRLLAAETALTGMNTRELNAAVELDIAEVDYLLRLANERLKLFSDPAGADRALEVADMHLAAMNNPIYTGVRQEIAAARRQLAAIDLPDYLELTSRLDAVQQKIAQLPFRSGDPGEAGAAEVAGDGWWDKVKGVFSNLVTIRRSTDEENARISLQDKDLIRQRAWLQLEIAHLALMRREQQAFTASLERVNETLSTWFSLDDSDVQTVINELDDLGSTDVEAEVPDITAPWSTLRVLRAGQPRPPAAAPVEMSPAESAPAATESEPATAESEPATAAEASTADGDESASEADEPATASEDPEPEEEQG